MNGGKRYPKMTFNTDKDFFRPQFLHHPNFVAEPLTLPEESLLHSAF